MWNLKAPGCALLVMIIMTSAVWRECGLYPLQIESGHFQVQLEMAHVRLYYFIRSRVLVWLDSVAHSGQLRQFVDCIWVNVEERHSLKGHIWYHKQVILTTWKRTEILHCINMSLHGASTNSRFSAPLPLLIIIAPFPMQCCLCCIIYCFALQSQTVW